MIISGAGNDDINAGPGLNVVSAGDGDDFVLGGSGRDVIIGGNGNYTIDAGDGQDLLIGGTTVHNSDLTALAAIMAEWTSGRSYGERLTNLRTGSGPELNANQRLEAGSTVLDYGAIDSLFGGVQRDWFFADLDTLGGDNDLITGQGADEELDQI